MKKEKLTKMFKEEVHNKAESIDPSSEEDWHSLTLGWAIGKGLSIVEAQEFSRYIRYDTDLG